MHFTGFKIKFLSLLNMDFCHMTAGVKSVTHGFLVTLKRVFGL